MRAAGPTVKSGRIGTQTSFPAKIRKTYGIGKRCGGFYLAPPARSSPKARRKSSAAGNSPVSTARTVSRRT